MHPAFSVLFFTVTSGFGYGFMLCLIVLQQTGLLELGPQDFLRWSLVAFALFTLGLMSSTLHLANPKNAWRSFVRFRTSWLSREGVFAILAYPILGAYVATVWFSQQGLWVNLLALVCVVLILVLLYCTAMIYASLKTIPQWHNRYVAPVFLALGLSSGLVCTGLVTNWQQPFLNQVALMVLVLSAVLKLLYFKSLGEPTRSSINTATSFSQASVSLFDAGHSSKNFLQREFVYEVGPKTTALARRSSLVLAFGIPVLLIALLWSGTLSEYAQLGAWLIVLSLYLGLLLERWLFFVEAKHVVRHYYDNY